jgi:tRNA pseudouridine38-40 synthase
VTGRIKLKIAYDGSGFRGWQSQAGGGTVQDLLEKAAATICRRPVTIHGAGRTDSGVHALGQCAHFDAPEMTLDCEAWRRAFNANLPPEVRVLAAQNKTDAFHARFSATGKVYQYVISTAPVLLPQHFRRAWHVPVPMDLPLLRDALRCFEGTQDFRNFAANRSKPVENTIRTVRRVQMTEQAGLVRITFVGDGFLYKMVRLMVGAGVRVARAREKKEWISELLANPAGPKCSYVAPADGLTLVRVLYR